MANLTEAAQEIIREHPEYGRRRVAKELRSEYGKALRDATILRLQREIYPERNLAVKAMRVNRLKKEGFTPYERKELSSLAFAKTGFLLEERRTRAREYRDFLADMKAKNFTKRQADRIWRSNISDRYADEGFTLEDGKPDFWQLFRKLRGEAIKGGKWKETPRYRGRSHRKLDAGGHHRKIDKGKVKLQRQRYYAKHQKKGGD